MSKVLQLWEVEERRVTCLGSDKCEGRCVTYLVSEKCELPTPPCKQDLKCRETKVKGLERSI